MDRRANTAGRREVRDPDAASVGIEGNPIVDCLAEAKQMGIAVGWMTGKGTKMAPENIKALLNTAIGRLP